MIDFETQALGQDTDGNDVYLKDIWPSRDEVAEVLNSAIDSEMFTERYGNAFDSNQKWNEIAVDSGDIYSWNDASTYIQEPPFMVDLPVEVPPVQPLTGAKALAMLGDSTTTDHISPAGAIAKDSPAGLFLQNKGVEPIDFNSYGSRRGNDRVMLRGTFANIRIRNQLAPGTEGGVTRYLPTGEVMSIYDAAMKYKEEKIPLVVIGGKEYGTGSSRDWAAKGTLLQGVKAVVTESFERIHRSNLIGMGVLPLQFKEGFDRKKLNITGEELITIVDIDKGIKPRDEVSCEIKYKDGTSKTIKVLCRIDTQNEVEYYKNGGILQYVLRNMLN